MNSSPLTILIPPLLMPSLGLLPFQRRLEALGHRTRTFRYPSYRRDIPTNANRFAHWLNSLGTDSVDVVTYSMGGIILRWAVNHGGPIPRLRRVVMIGPPNQGAWIATRLDQMIGPLYPLAVGAAAKQLRAGDQGLCASAGLLPPSTEIGIIAGGRNTTRGYNPLIPGDNDRILKPEETKLDGMKEWILIRAAHGPLIFKRQTADLTHTFLTNATFHPHTRSTQTAPHSASSNTRDKICTA